MTIKELKNKVAVSKNLEWYQKRTITLNYPHINYQLVLTGIPAIYSYINRQIDGYEEFNVLPPQIESVKNNFITVRDRIISLINSDSTNDYDWNNCFNPITNSSILIFPSDSSETQFLIHLKEKQPEYFKGAYEYFIGNTQNSNVKNNFIGYVMSYEFTYKDESSLFKRKETERKSISKIRNDFQKQVLESENQLADYIARTTQKYEEYSSKLDTFKEENEKSYNEWFHETSINIKKINENSLSKINELEILYREKLKLEAPAKYWSERSKLLRKEGYGWLIALVACIVIAIIILIWVLLKISTGTIDKIFQNSGTAIRWSIVLIMLISFLAFAIRTFSKLSFSSFHLVRDAEEREQLTYVYLALQKENTIDDTGKHMIMQSLFSRADSGLLKDDASPTMPGNIVDKMISK